MEETNNPVSFLEPRESILRFREMEQVLFPMQNISSDTLPPAERYASALFQGLCLGHREAVSRLNTREIQCSVAWDEKLNFPSVPSFVADAVSYAKHFSDSEELKKLLLSFEQWTPLLSQEMKCACGEFKFRTVMLEIMAYHKLYVMNNGLKLSMFFGVKTNDKKHRKYHYGDVASLVPDVNISGMSVPHFPQAVLVCAGGFRIERKPALHAVQEFFSCDKTFRFETLCFSGYMHRLHHLLSL